MTETPDVVLCDLARDAEPPAEAEAPVVVLTDQALPSEPARRRAAARGHRGTARSRAARGRRRAAGARAGRRSARRLRAAADDAPPLLTPREAEILTLVGQGMSNKAVARALGISVHTVKFHLEALFAKLEATSRAEAVAKGLRGGVIEL